MCYENKGTVKDFEIQIFKHYQTTEHDQPEPI